MNTGADSGDWNPLLNGFRQVQDAFGIPGELTDLQLNIDTNEWIAFDVVGHNLNATTFATDLMNAVNNLHLQSGVNVTLIHELNDVKPALAQNKPQQALQAMRAFDASVSQFRSQGLLSPSDAATLLAQASNIESIISGL